MERKLNLLVAFVTSQRAYFQKCMLWRSLPWEVIPAEVVTDGCFPFTDNTVTHNTSWGLSHCGTFKLTVGMKHLEHAGVFFVFFITVDYLRVCVWCWGADPSFCLSGPSTLLEQQSARGPAALGCWAASKTKAHVVSFVHVRKSSFAIAAVAHE